MALFLNILLPNPGFVGNEWKANFLPQYPWEKVLQGDNWWKRIYCSPIPNLGPGLCQGHQPAEGFVTQFQKISRTREPSDTSTFSYDRVLFEVNGEAPYSWNLVTSKAWLNWSKLGAINTFRLGFRFSKVCLGWRPLRPFYNCGWSGLEILRVTHQQFAIFKTIYLRNYWDDFVEIFRVVSYCFHALINSHKAVPV